MTKNNLMQQAADIVPFIQDGGYFYKKGLKAYRSRNLEKARKYMERALELEPYETAVICQLAVILSEMGEYKKSNELLEQLITNIEPELYDSFYLLANNYAHLGLFQEARKYADQYLKIAPDGEHTDDVEDLLALINIDVDHEQFLDEEDELIIKQENACYFLEKGQFSEAISLFEQLTIEYPEFWASYNNLAFAYYHEGEKEKALSLTEYVLEQNEGNLHALCNLMIFYFYMNEKEKVKTMVEQLEKVFPIDPDHRLKLGTTFTIVGHYEKGFYWLRSLYKTRYDAITPNFYYLLSLSAFHAGELHYAKEVWAKVMQVSPEKDGKEPWLS